MSALVLQEAGLGEVESTARGALHLFGDYSLADPVFLVLVPLGIVLLFWGRGRSSRPHGRMSLTPASVRPSLRQRFAPLPSILQGVALVLAVVALARPLRANVQHDVTSEGIDIVLALDHSGSMRFDDLEKGKNRLQVVKEVVADFAERRMTDREGAADNVALLRFARFPQLLCPFTLDVIALQGFLDSVELVRYREEDGTAIGVALAKCVSVLSESPAKSKVVVLLTDGENNVMDITPVEAAALAAEEDIRVYTIYAARYLYRHDILRGYVPVRDQADTSELEHIAELTGGRFYRAKDRASLQDIYAEIEELERTERTERRFEETFDLYLWFLVPGLGLYLFAWLSNATWARRIP